MVLVAIKDTKAKIYEAPLTFPTVVSATRSFQTAVANKESTYGKYPNDFQLHHIGTFDIHTGKLEISDPPVVICSAIDLAHEL